MNAHRKKVERQRSDCLAAVAESRELIQREWWLSRTVRAEAQLQENGGFGDSYRTTPKFFVTEHFSDSLGERGPAAIGALDPWQIQAIMRLKAQWQAWCDNDLNEMPAAIDCPGIRQVDGKWVDVWPDGVNPWPEAGGEAPQ